MARIKNIKQYDTMKARLLTEGLELMQTRSFSAIGINDVLKKSNIPKGSFYHYFKSKENFGLEVAEFYHHQQMKSAKEILRNDALTSIERLQLFFQTARESFANRSFKHGCLMCNLSTELGDNNTLFQTMLVDQWDELATELTVCVTNIHKSELGLPNLSYEEIANWLLNAWSGALTRMKALGNDKPLRLFEKTIFINKECI